MERVANEQAEKVIMQRVYEGIAIRRVLFYFSPVVQIN